MKIQLKFGRIISILNHCFPEDSSTLEESDSQGPSAAVDENNAAGDSCSLLLCSVPLTTLFCSWDETVTFIFSQWNRTQSELEIYRSSIETEDFYKR